MQATAQRLWQAARQAQDEGDLGGALGAAWGAVELCAATDDVAEYAASLAELGALHAELDQSEPALLCWSKAVDCLEALGDIEAATRVRARKAELLAAARGPAAEALELAEAARHIEVAGRLAEARAMWARAAESCRRAEDPRGALHALARVAELAAQAGDLDSEAAAHEEMATAYLALGKTELAESMRERGAMLRAASGQATG